MALSRLSGDFAPILSVCVTQTKVCPFRTNLRYTGAPDKLTVGCDIDISTLYSVPKELQTESSTCEEHRKRDPRGSPSFFIPWQIGQSAASNLLLNASGCLRERRETPARSRLANIWASQVTEEVPLVQPWPWSYAELSIALVGGECSTQLCTGPQTSQPTSLSSIQYAN